MRTSLWGPLGDGLGSIHGWIESQYNLHLRPIKLNLKVVKSRARIKITMSSGCPFLWSFVVLLGVKVCCIIGR